LAAIYPTVEAAKADIIVALGGDGFMLHTLHRFMDLGKPIFGMNRGSVGFMMNEYSDDGLMERLARAEAFQLKPLRMTAVDHKGKKHTALAINEVSLTRISRMAAKIRILIDGVERMAEMICDGALVATPAGSTAYNLSVHGPILPLGSPLLALTPISVFRPRQWRGALLPHEAEVTFEIMDRDKRPVGAVADFSEVPFVTSVTIREDDASACTLLFDPEHNLEERILKEQFLP
ncbi:MAG TPA: NAD kinase, partial [Alphaproteobacteria bacterium]|nr:NAD kinase [Alphaproteobacteria bacterium]